MNKSKMQEQPVDKYYGGAILTNYAITIKIAAITALV